jgi:hypothetical protein
MNSRYPLAVVAAITLWLVERRWRFKVGAEGGLLVCRMDGTFTRCRCRAWRIVPQGAQAVADLKQVMARPVIRAVLACWPGERVMLDHGTVR